MANNLNPFDILRKRNTSSQQMGCRRPGCGCLIFIVLLLLAGSFLFKYMGGSIPTINLPGGGTIFNEQQEEEKARLKEEARKAKEAEEEEEDVEEEEAPAEDTPREPSKVEKKLTGFIRDLFDTSSGN